MNKQFHEDDIFRLTYAFIMLNTDQHNKEVEKKMTLEDFRKVVRSVVNDQMFDDKEIETAYFDIKNNEIKNFNVEKLI